MNSGQGNEILAELVVREERIAEDAVAVVCKTPTVVADGLV